MDNDKKIVGKYGFFIKTAALFIPLVCQTDLSFDRTRDAVDGDSACGSDQRPAPTATYEVSGTAQILRGDGTTRTDEASEAEIDALFKDAIVFDWQIGPLSGDPQPGDTTYSGKGWFSKLTTSWPLKEMATFDWTLAVTGEYDTDVEPATT